MNIQHLMVNKCPNWKFNSPAFLRNHYSPADLPSSNRLTEQITNTNQQTDIEVRREVAQRGRGVEPPPPPPLEVEAERALPKLNPYQIELDYLLLMLLDKKGLR